MTPAKMFDGDLWVLASDAVAMAENAYKNGQAAERNKLAQWMMTKGYATGHGDTVEDLLKELEWQVRESEREACAKVCEDKNTLLAWPTYAAAIRARGQS
jgi:hypothetical protein